MNGPCYTLIKHVVIAHHPIDTSEVVVYNTAGMNFLEEAGTQSFFHFIHNRQIMTEMLWPASTNNNSDLPSSSNPARASRRTFNVVHLGVQGVNDCGYGPGCFSRSSRCHVAACRLWCGAKGRNSSRAEGGLRIRGWMSFFRTKFCRFLLGTLALRREKLEKMTACSKSIDQTQEDSMAKKKHCLQRSGTRVGLISI